MNNDKIVTISFKVWANDDSEADTLSRELGAFVDEQGKQGRKVTAAKLTEALRRWQNNVLVRNAVNSHFAN